MKYLLITCFFIFCYTSLFAQNNTYNKDSAVIISDIIITGNKKTRNNIILREMVIQKRDTVLKSELTQKVELSKQLIFNTTLFVSTEIVVAQGADNEVTLIIDVKERWYIFPLPYFKWVDRNFNEWWTTHKASLDRVNYGLKFFHNNLTGRNDKLSLNLITGYNRQTSLRYEIPFFDKKLQHGFSMGFGISKQKEVNYATSLGNERQFLKLEENFTREFESANFTYSYRPDQYWRHNVRFNYISDKVADTIVKLNPNYFGLGRNKLQYAELLYGIQYIKTNYNPYPTKGLMVKGSIGKRGFNSNLDMWQLQIASLFAFPIKNKGYGKIEFAGTTKFPTNNIFINQQLFGYGDFTLRGQELYVADGLAGAISKLTLGYELANFKIKTPIKNKAYSKIPFRVFAKVFSDFGYSYNPNVTNNLLNNKLMRTWGVGVDILSIYDFVLRLEYGFNQFGNSGLFVNTGL